MGESWTVNCERTLKQFKARVDELYEAHKYVTFEWSTGRQRTKSQNSALHVFCRQVADALNASGYEMQVTSQALKGQIETPWTEQAVKALIWRPVQVAKFPDKASTVDLDRPDVTAIAEVITRHLSERFGLQVSFPSREGKRYAS